jgi:hypothetical protein
MKNGEVGEEVESELGRKGKVIERREGGMGFAAAKFEFDNY